LVSLCVFDFTLSSFKLNIKMRKLLGQKWLMSLGIMICGLHVIYGQTHTEPSIKSKVTSLNLSAITPSLVDPFHTSEGFLISRGENEISHFFRIDPGQKADHTRNKGMIVRRISVDGGETWSPSMPVFDNPLFDDRNIHGGLIGRDTVVLFFRTYDSENSETKGLFSMISSDGGRTWKNPVDFKAGLEMSFGTHNLIRLPEIGYLMALYSPGKVDLRVSADGITWPDTSFFQFDYTGHSDFLLSETSFATDGKGMVIGLIRDSMSGRGKTFLQVTSFDNGKTWSEPHRTFIGDPFGGPAPQIFYIPETASFWTVATDRRDQIMEGYPAQASNIWIYQLIRSHHAGDQGTWKVMEQFPRPSPNGHRFYGYPTVTRTEAGRYLVVVTESYKKVNKMEDADFYQFEILLD
jgi:hypothetical protein